MKTGKIIILLTFFLFAALTADAQEQIVRKDLGVAQLGTAEINKIEMREITLKPLQKTGLHLHPGGTVGYIVTGEILFQVEGQESKMLKSGDAFYEPPGARITHFDNTSKKRPAKFAVFYPLKDGQALIEMIKQ